MHTASSSCCDCTVCWKHKHRLLSMTCFTEKSYILSGKMIVPFLLLRTWLQTVPSGDVSGIHGSHYNTYLISIIYCFLYSICFFLLSFKSRVRFGMTGKSLWDIFSQSHFMSLSSVALLIPSYGADICISLWDSKIKHL